MPGISTRSAAHGLGDGVEVAKPAGVFGTTGVGVAESAVVHVPVGVGVSVLVGVAVMLAEPVGVGMAVALAALVVVGLTLGAGV